MSSISRSIRRRRELVALAKILNREGARGWIVGGAPRDRLLGRRETDVDVAITGDAERIARELHASGFGTAVAISESAPRVFRVAGRRDLDLAELEGESIERDLARRDFTANAIAIDLATGAWIDPYGGVRDVAKRRLRLVRASNLDDDPLRAFRAARLYATHGLRPDAATFRAVRAIGGRVSGAAPERATAELTKLLEAERAAPALRWAEAATVLRPALGLRSAPASASRAVTVAARLDPVLRDVPPPERVSLRLAAIALGVGMTAETASRWLRERRHGRAEGGRVGRLMSLVGTAALARTPRQRWTWVYDAGPLAIGATKLLEARNPRMAGTARRLRRLSSRPRRGPRIRGGDLIAWLSLPAGPEVGRLLREVEIEIRRGSLRSRADARRWLEGAVRRSKRPFRRS